MYLPISAMLAQRRYRVLAVIRASFLIGFVAILLIFRANASPVTVAWLFQLMMVMQGLVLLFFIRTYFLDQPEASQRIAE